MTDGIKCGDEVEFTGEMLSVLLGPGLLGQIYDGLQNPLPELAKQAGWFLERGVYALSLIHISFISPSRSALPTLKAE